MNKLSLFGQKRMETMKLFVLSVLLLLSLAIPAAGSVIIDFDALIPDGQAFLGPEEDGFRTFPSGQGWTQQSGIGGNSTTAVFTTLDGIGNINSHLITYVPFAEHEDAEFFFHGFDLYTSRPMSTSALYSIFVIGREGPDPGPEVFRFQPNLTETDGSIFHHISADGHLAWDGVTPVSEAVIGALEVTITRGTGGSAVTVGADNIRLCHNDGTSCTFGAPQEYTLPGGAEGNHVPEPSSMMLLGTGLAGIAKLRRKK